MRSGLLVLMCISLSACNTAAKLAVEKVAEVALGSIGVQLASNQNSADAKKTVAMRVEAANNLNANDNGQGLTTVMRLYKLRDQNNFMATPYAAFGSEDKEKSALGADLVEVRELTLSPGQALDLKEKMTGDAAYLGVVTLFRNPYPRRWRFAFAVADAQHAPITLGVHNCAMTATSIAPMGMSSSEASLLSAIRCK